MYEKMSDEELIEKTNKLASIQAMMGLEFTEHMACAVELANRLSSRLGSEDAWIMQKADEEANGFVSAGRLEGFTEEPKDGWVSEDRRRVVVCSECLTATCWRGDFYCDKYKTAGTMALRVDEAKRLNREHWSYIDKYAEPLPAPPKGEGS